MLLQAEGLPLRPDPGEGKPVILAGLFPVFDDDDDDRSDPVLYDIFIGEAWHGSLRKLEWAEAYVRRQLGRQT